MRKIVFVFILLISVQVVAGNLKKNISEIQEKAKIPGLQVMVYEGDKVLFEYAQGLRAVGQTEKITRNDIWHWGSITKPMTAVLIGQLIDEGKISLQTKIKDLLPKKFKIHPSLENVTVMQLLGHRSGVAEATEPFGGRLWMSAFRPFSETAKIREGLVRGVLEMPAKTEPGYVNSGYILLGWIIEQLRKESWERVITKNIFDKLEMRTCGFGPAGQENKKVAKQPWGHSIEKNGWVALPPNEKADNPYALGPAGTVHCAVDDLNKFIRIFFKDETYRAKVISAKTLESLLTSPYSPEETLMTFAGMERGWAQGRGFFMAGSNTLNYAVMAFAPNTGRSYFINTNTGAKMDEVTAQILKLVFDEDFGKSPRK